MTCFPERNSSMLWNFNFKFHMHVVGGYGRSLLIFSNVTFKMDAGGPLGFFSFRALTSVWLWISSPNFSSTLLVCMEKKPIDFQICHFQNGRLVAILDFLVSGLLLQIGFEFQIQTSAAHFLHVLVNRRLVILKDVQLQSIYCPLIPISPLWGYPSRSLIYSF